MKQILRKSIVMARLLAAAISLTGSAFAAPGDILFATEFNTPADLEGWVDNLDRLKAFGWNGDTITGEESVEGGVFRAKVATASTDPQLIRTPFSPTVDANLAGTIQIRIRQSPDDGATWKAAGSLTGFLVLLNPGNFNASASLVQTPDETVAGDGWTMLTYNIDNYVNQNLNNFRFDPSATLDESFEIDFIRILETSNPRPLTEVNPGTAIPEEFNLVRQWDDATELAELTTNNFTSKSIGTSSLGGPQQSLFAVNSTNGDPQIQTPPALGIPVGPSDQLIVEIAFIPSTSSTMDPAQLFWSDNSGGYAALRRLDFATSGLASGVRHIIRATFTNHIDTELKQLRFDPLNTAGKDFELDYIRIYSDATDVENAGLAWDTDTVTSGAQGGTGTWNTTDLFWNNGTDNLAWPSPPIGNDNAVFGAAPGTVTIDAGGITVHNMIFESTGYEITGGDLIFDDSFSAAKISVLENLSATISSEIVSDGTHVRKINPGALIIANDATMDSFSIVGGNTTVSAGTTLSTLVTNPAENGFGLKLTGLSTVLNIDGTVNVGAGPFGGFSQDSGYTINLNAGGALNTPADAYMGWNGSATYNFNGGTSNIGGNLIHLDSGSGNVNFAGGTHAIAGRVGSQTNGSNSHSVVTIDGGNVSAGTVGYTAGTFASAPLGTNSFTLNLNGGSLQTDNIFLNRGTATNPGDITFNLVLNGGTLIASPGGTSPTLIDGNLGNAFFGPLAFNVSVEENGVTIDTNGENKSIDQALLAGGTSGGTLAKTGAGNLYLNRDNEYDGQTLVAAGYLGGTGSVNGGVTVNPGAGLAYFVTDPAEFADPLYVYGSLSLPDPLVISIDSESGTFQENAAGGLVLVSAFDITGFNQANVSFDLSNFTGTGTWSVEKIGNELVLEYTLSTGGYSAWAAANAGGQGPDFDFDNDGISNGVEYFMGETGSSFTPNPALVNGTITWPKDPAFAGTFMVQISDDLNGWTDIVPPDASIAESDPNQVVFTMPAGGPKKFARLSVAVTP